MADESMFIEIPLTKGRELIRKAYELSAPRGLGHIHYRKGGLGESEVDEIIAAAGKTGFNRYADMDYVNGRSVKMPIYFADGGNLKIWRHWPDHGETGMLELLAHLFGDAKAREMLQ